MSEYAHQRGIAHKPAFNYWAPHVLKKGDAIISLVKNRKPQYLKRTHKFGVEFTKSVADVHAIDKKNENTFWADGIAKEVKNVRVEFDVAPDSHRIPQNYQFFHCHIIFGMNMEDFRLKLRYTAGGRMKNSLPTITYTSVVGRETAQIAFTFAVLDGLEVNSSDIKNTYATAPVTKKIWTNIGEEFGANSGKNSIIVRALYGSKSSGTAFRNYLGDCIRHIGYASCLADPDLWMNPMTKADSERYYSYILNYVDDVLIISKEAGPILAWIGKYFKLK